MNQTEKKELKKGISLNHIIITALAIVASTILAMYAVITAPVSPFPGVSGLYLAAAIYVPLSLWLGMWGCLTGYFSCLLLGLITTPFGAWNLVWAFADFLEGFIPLLAFRLLKSNVDIGNELKNRIITKIILIILIVDVVIASIATALAFNIIWIVSLCISISLIFLLYVINKSKSWLIYVIFGVFSASAGSALIGVIVPIFGGFAPIESFWTGFIGWFAGDIIVLSTISTPIMVLLTRYIKKTSIFVDKWWI